MGRFLGSDKIAAKNNIDGIFAKESLQALRLFAAFFIQRNIGVALHATKIVPICLPVSKDVYDSWHSAPIEALARGNGKGKDLNMTAILKAFRQAFDSLLRLQMFWLILLPPFLSVFGFFVLFVIFWSAWVTGLGNFLAQMSIFQWLQSLTGLNGFASWTAVIFLILVFIPLAYLGAVLLTSIFVMPIVLLRVAGTDFKHLEKKKGGTTVGSLWNTLWATMIFIVAFVVTLPLWLVPGCQVVVPLFLTAWLNKKIFLYDVLQDYASLEERKRIEREDSGTLYGLGLLLGLLSYIPLAIFFVPVLSALSYTYYGLNALQERRSGET